MSTDIVIAAVPSITTKEPMMAPAYLKSIVQVAGYSAVALDLNQEFAHRIKNRPNKKQLVDFAEHSKPMLELSEEVGQEVAYMVERILSYKPKKVALSLFAYTCQRFAKWVCVVIRQVAPEVEIVMGGSGTKHTLNQESNYFVEELKQQGLIDHYIMGDGERAIVEYMNGNLSYPGIDSQSWQQPMDLSEFPYSDFSDYDFNLYEDKVIPILDSQGCVRKCEFCDIIEHWQAYTWKKASYTFDEMLYQSKKHGIYRFSMRNSLTNGNMIEFRNWIEQVADYNKTAPAGKEFSWLGYFNIRGAHAHPEPLWEKMAESNATLIVGLESVIEEIRWDMGKKFTNADVDYHLDMGRKYNVPIVFLMMASNPGETLDHFEYTKKWFKDRLEYAGNSVTAVFYALATILPGTVWDKLQGDKIDIGPTRFIWTEKGNELTHRQRLDYLESLIDICKPFNEQTSVDYNDNGYDTKQMLSYHYDD